jgi:hypothetical protein
MSDVVKKIRNVFDDTEKIASWCDDTYEGRETYTHLLGLYETALEAASEIELLRAALTELVEAAEETWGKDRPCVRIARAALEAKNE